MCYSLSVGEKKTSEVGLVLFQRYVGTGFPELEEQLRVTFPFSTGFPDMEHLGTAGGTGSRTWGHLSGGQRHQLCVLLTDESAFTFDVHFELLGEGATLGQDHLARVPARVRLLGVVDEDRHVEGGHRMLEANAALELGFGGAHYVFSVGDDLHRGVEQ